MKIRLKGIGNTNSCSRIYVGLVPLLYDVRLQSDILYRPVIDLTAWHGEPTPATTIVTSSPPSGLSYNNTPLTLWHGLLKFLTQHDIFPNLRDWGSGDTTHKAREWHCNTSNDTRGVLWGYNMPLMMGEGAAGQNTRTPHIKILQSLLLWLLSWDWGGVSVAEWRM